MSEEERDQIFISYSHKDKVWLERIRTHLSGAVRNRLIDPWDDSKIRPGSNWKDEIKRALARAKVAVDLHVSPSPFGVSPRARLSDAGCFAGDEYYFSLKFARESPPYLLDRRI
jgi:TIR domain